MITILHDKVCGTVFWASPCICDDNSGLLMHGHLGCPECARRADDRGEAGTDLHGLIAELRSLTAEERLVVLDPLSDRILAGPAVTSVAINGPAIQVTLHSDWWSQIDESGQETHLGFPPTGVCPWHVALRSCQESCEEQPDCGVCAGQPQHSEPDGQLMRLCEQLQWLNTCHNLAIWEPVSRRLLTGQAIHHVATNGACIQVGLSPIWMQAIDNCPWDCVAEGDAHKASSTNNDRTFQ